jgi:hypothetical protein
MAWSGWRKSSIRLIGQDAARIAYRLSCLHENANYGLQKLQAKHVTIIQGAFQRLLREASEQLIVTFCRPL